MKRVQLFRSVLPVVLLASLVIAACSSEREDPIPPTPEIASSVDPAARQADGSGPTTKDDKAPRRPDLSVEDPVGAVQPGDPPKPQSSESGPVIPAQDAASSTDAPGPSFGMTDLEAIARDLASREFIPSIPLPKAAADLNYDQFRRIQNQPSSVLWSDAPSDYRVALDPRGYLFADEVRINLIDEDGIRAFNYDAGQFSFEDLPLDDETRRTLGFSGFRLQAPFNTGGKFDEVISFRGASFFRALGAGSVYGASARGISVGTASPDGEEFPFFREYWIEKAKPGDRTVPIYALLDGKSVTGAFMFEVSPGPTTRVYVSATIFPRRRLENVGVVPLTSMYYFSPHDVTKVSSDYRPAVHDSQGLSFRLSNGEWVWRPLTNPTELQVSVLAQDVPRGFGLMQRLRSFDAYADIEADYHLRPSVWVEPGKGWERGQLTLVEIPTTNEYNDNIVVFWRPGTPWKAGEGHSLSYTLHWGLQTPAIADVVPVKQSRAGRTPGMKRHLFVIDFESADPALMSDMEASVSTSAGTVSNVIIRREPEAGLTRLSFELDAENAQSAELRALIMRGGRPLTETWIYRWSLP